MTGARAPLATPVVNAKTTLQFVLVTGSFEAGKTYYTRCVAINGQPRAWLANAPDGSDLPQGFTSICTRECPRDVDEALSTVTLRRSAAEEAAVVANEPSESPPSSPAAQTHTRMDPEHPLRIGERYYPPESLKAREQGRCIVSVTVGADGWIKDARIQQSTGYARLDQACLDAVAGGHLIPATQNGMPIKKSIALPIVWSLP
jgi:TonB family protein